MKRFVSLLLVMVLVASVAAADDTVVPKVKAGDKALLFTLSGLGNLGAGEFAGGIGFKYYFANNFAGRIGLGFSSTSSSEQNPNDPVPATQKGEREESFTEFSIAPGVTYSLVTNGPVTMYVGGQVLFAMSSSSEDGAFGSGYDADSKRERSTTTFGVGAIIGVEWFPWQNIGLSAEYILSFATSSGETEDTIDGTSDTFESPTVTNFGTSAGNAANLTVAVYF